MVTRNLLLSVWSLGQNSTATPIYVFEIAGNSGKFHRPISVCQTTSTKLLSLEEARDKYKQVGPAEIPKYHTVININTG
jgi:hypothetical protein